jgi:hypothetical protein
MTEYKSLLGTVSLEPEKKDSKTGYRASIWFRRGRYLPHLGPTWGVGDFIEADNEKDALGKLREHEVEEIKNVAISVSDSFLKRKVLNLFRCLNMYGTLRTDEQRRVRGF